MAHDIIDNRDIKLVDRIREILPQSKAAKFAVGYFFLSGLEAVADQLADVEELRLLIGNTSDHKTIEQLAEGYHNLKRLQHELQRQAHPSLEERQSVCDIIAAGVGEAAALMEQTPAAEKLVRTLAQLVEAGRLKVRVYTKGRLHAKAYIFDYKPGCGSEKEAGVAIVGSSNFTLSGIATNTELNVVVKENPNHAELTAWFEARWNEAEDFEGCLMQELRSAWPFAQVTPYEVYLKVLYELVQEQLAGAAAETALWHDDIGAVLTEFQAHAVRQAAQIIRRYGGCFISDVVGLGKSYIGTAIVRHFVQRHLARPLIICPAPLESMWQHYNEVYRLNARVLSMGMLTEDKVHGADWMALDERYRDRDFVLVDESHNFRNPNSQRYRVLHSFLGSGERQCCFLTATPRNKSVWDIYHQLKLFHQDEMTALPIDPPNLKAFFKQVESGERRLPDLLAHLLIRRTRAHILRWYGYDEETETRLDPDDFRPYLAGERRAYIRVGGRQQFFPQRKLTTIQYSIEATYQGLYGQLRHYLTAGGEEGLRYARYGLWQYVAPSKREHAPYRDLQRAGANLRGLMRVMLFKRFESSVHAFRQTLQRMANTHRTFLAALDQDMLPAGDEARQLLAEADGEEPTLTEALKAISGRYKTEDFDVAALRADLEHDLAVLESMVALVAPITPEQDAKLQTLKARLSQAPLGRGKVLIFTQYADTARYLFATLAPDHPSPDIAVIHSEEGDKGTIVARFAPKANPQQQVLDKIEIDTLIATDVLSEGLNLQDCDKVINYDLHWNPVRLIQRFGRIDRIGSEHEVIYAYNFLPETELDQNLGLHEKLARRIQEIHDSIGEDAAILEPEEQLNPEALYTIYAEGEVGAYEEADEAEFIDLNEAEELIRQLQEDDPQLYQRILGLRDGIRTATRGMQAGTVVLCRAGRYRQLYLVDQHGTLISRDTPRILGLLKCSPDTPPLPLPQNHNDVVSKVRQQFEREVHARRAEQEHTLSLSPAQQYVLTELRIANGQSGPERQAQIALLE
ncbi:MAG: helicase-related protein, partial [Anaerolineae bacterium]|nr:helicase-related protein [Anaerolineae bacterium]